MTKTWQLQDAKNRFSEVVEDALKEGYQIVTRRGEPVVAIVSIQEFKRLRQGKETLLQFFEDSPLYGAELDVERKKDLPRSDEL
jgi:antitoxin Phd